MKKLMVISIIVFGIVSWWAGKNIGSKVIKSVASVKTSSSRITSVAPFTNPVSLKIPRLGIDATIEHVGLDDRNYMDVPKNDMNAGWYNLGTRIGDKGSAVIAGHFDTKTGSPAVFYEINKLQAGDEIIVTDENGKVLIFEVTETQTVKDADFPIEKVFVKNDIPRLNLITCAGRFDNINNNYEDRFVVFTVLKNIS